MKGSISSGWRRPCDDGGIDRAMLIYPEYSASITDQFLWWEWKPEMGAAQVVVDECKQTPALLSVAPATVLAPFIQWTRLKNVER